MSTRTGKLKFGPWLLDQVERDDAVGSMARAWKQLKEASGYTRVTGIKSISQLLSARLGENWQQMHGDAVLAEAEKEWERSSEGEPDRGILPPEQGTIFDLPADAAALLPTTLTPAATAAPQYAVLVVDGREFELTPGRRYVIDFGTPVLRDVEGFEQRGSVHLTSVLPDGHINWSALHEIADHNLPEGADLVSLGLPEE